MQLTQVALLHYCVPTTTLGSRIGDTFRERGTRGTSTLFADCQKQVGATALAVSFLCLLFDGESDTGY